VKKKAILVSLAVVLLAAAVIGQTYASFNTESEAGTTTINLEDLKVALAASVDDTNSTYFIENGLPGQEKEVSNFKVENALKENAYDLYTRVIIDKQWSGSSKDVLDAGKIVLYNGTDPLDSTSVGKNINGWIVAEADAEHIVLYYNDVLAPEEVTSDFITKVAFDKDMNNDYANKEASIVVNVYAVQKVAADKAMPSEWGVYPEFDENGVIISITE